MTKFTGIVNVRFVEVQLFGSIIKNHKFGLCGWYFKVRRCRKEKFSSYESDYMGFVTASIQLLQTDNEICLPN